MNRPSSTRAPGSFPAFAIRCCLTPATTSTLPVTISSNAVSGLGARIQIMTASLGPAKTHTEAECEEMVKGHDRPNTNRRYIDYYISEVVD